MNNNLTHHWEGGYLIPDLIQPESPHIGIWGERRRRFLRTHQKLVYDAMLISGTLNSHLEEVDRNADCLGHGSNGFQNMDALCLVGFVHAQHLRVQL